MIVNDVEFTVMVCNFVEALFHVFSGIKVIDDVTLLHALGAVMNNAIDWDGFRAKRYRHSIDQTLNN